MDMPQSEPARFHTGSIVAGAVLLGLGGALLLDTTGVVSVPIRKLVAPIVLITLGSLIVLEKGAVVYGYRERLETGERKMRVRRRGATSGFWLIGVGVWMLVSQLHVFGLSYGTSWPLFIILSGVIMVMRGVR